MKLRDHNQRCEHGGYFDCAEPLVSCPGGAEVETVEMQWCTTHECTSEANARCWRALAAEMGGAEGIAECVFLSRWLIGDSDG